MMNDALKIKIGQMIMSGIPGERVSEDFTKLCREYRIGNFCVSAENAVSLDILCDINSDIRKKTYENTGIYPFISIDQEGGWVSRFYEGAAFIQGNMSHAAAGFNRERMEAVGSRLGRILRALGCNMNNAPVLDVNSNESCPVIGTRSFGDDPEMVAELGCGFMRGLNEAGVCAIVKHFPGHGNTRGDTHLITSRNCSDMVTFTSTPSIMLSTSSDKAPNICPLIVSPKAACCFSSSAFPSATCCSADSISFSASARASSTLASSFVFRSSIFALSSST